MDQMCSAIYPLIPRQDFLDVRDPDIYVYIDDPSINMQLKWGLLWVIDVVCYRYFLLLDLSVREVNSFNCD